MSSPTAPLQPPRSAPATPPHPACILDIRPHPLTDEGRGVGLVRLPEGGSVADLIAAALAVGRAELPALAPAIEATLDGRRIAGDAWAATDLAAPGDLPTLTLRLAVRGDDSDPLQTVLQVALILASVAVGHVAGPVAAAAILIGGNLVLNSVFTPDLPPPPATPAVEPQYSLSGGANRARPWAPLPLVLGTHRLFPDLAAREFTEFRNGAQFLHQIFSFGVGDLDIGDRILGDTPLDDYSDVRQQLVAPGAQVTLLDRVVATVAGGKLEQVAAGAAPADWNRIWVQRRTALDTTWIDIDLVASLFDVGSGGALRNRSAEIQIQWRAAGSAGAWSGRRVALVNGSRAPLRRSEGIRVAKGQYDVRVRSADLALAEDARAVQDVTWTALRSYRARDEDRGADTRLAVEVRASGQLSGRLERLSAIVSQKVPVWNGAAWTADDAAGRRASSNPAAVFRAFARGWRDAGGRLLAGSGRPAAEIDDAVLGRWHARCETRGATCDLVVDGSASPEEIEALIARRGQAAPSWATGKLGVVWEDPDAPVAASVTPARVLAGSVAVRWTSGEVAEEIVARFIDAEGGWERSEYRALMPGVTGSPAYTATVELTGATRRAQAVRECHLQAARQIYHRRRVSWAMGRDGATVARGDVVYLSHDLVSGGVTGRLAGGSAAAPRLDRAIDIAAGSSLLVEAPDGSLHQSAVSGADGSETDTPTLADPLPADPSARVEGAGPEDWTWRLYSAAAPPLKMRIVEVSPRAVDRFEIVAIDESAQYHAAADLPAGAPIPAPPAWEGPRIVDVHIAETLLRVGAGWAVEIELVITVAGDWRGGAVLASLDDGPSRRVARFDPGDDSASWIVPPTGTLDIVIVPGSAVAPTGPAWRGSYTIGGALAAPGTPANFLIDALPDGTRRFRWTPPPDIDLAGVEIRYAEDRVRAIPWDDMTPLHRGLLTASPWETFEPSAGSWVFALRAVDTGGRVSPDTRIVATLPDRRLGPTALFRTPSASFEGRPAWPSPANAPIVGVLSDDGRAAIEAAANYTWADLAREGTTWATWATWATGHGSGAAASVRWTGEPEDIEAEVQWSVAFSAPAAENNGVVSLRFRGGATEAACLAAAWHTLGAEGAPATLAARWVQVEVTAAAGTSAVSSLDHLSWWLPAPVVEVKHEDVATSGWSGSKGARIVPRRGLTKVTDVLVTLQGVGAGASWDIASKNPTVVLRLWDGAGAALDATVDVILRGLK